MECFDDVHTGGGKIESFVSYCGGLPAPEASVKYYFNMLLQQFLAFLWQEKNHVMQVFI